tara:strand:+ start:79 stop:213 length:135 start_codon:yes stop_codon:yes gene_type:complete
MARKGPIITQAWLQGFYAGQVKPKYKGSIKNKKINNKKNARRKR